MEVIKNIKPNVRRLNDMKEVLCDKRWAKTAPNLELYYMYRGVKNKSDLRYDITVIPAQMLGKEFVKTKGHDHANNYGEIYIVLKGEALYLMQKYDNGVLKDAYAVRAKKGQVVIIPPHYGHITINPLKKTLKEANWVSVKCKNTYDLFVEKQGACYYFTKAGWLKNKNYKKIPKLRFEKPLNKIPQKLDFLNDKTKPKK